MFDMGFLPDIRKILKRLPTKRQTLLFSATMPDDIRKLAVGDIENVPGERIERRTLVDFDYSVPVPAGSGGGDRARHSGQRRSAKVSGYAPVKKRGDSLHGTPERREIPGRVPSAPRFIQSEVKRRLFTGRTGVHTGWAWSW